MPSSRSLAVVAVVVLFTQEPQPRPQRQHPNPFEHTYEALATNLSGMTETDSSAICERIAPTSLDRRGLFSSWHGDYAIRSSCFMAVALNAGMIDLCSRIPPPPPGIRELSGVSRQQCEAGVRAGRRGGGSSYGTAGAALLLFTMGYTDADVTAAYATHPGETRFGDFLSDLVASKEVRTRTGRLPDFSHGDEVARQQWRTTMPRCGTAGESFVCQVVTCGFVRGAEASDRCFEAVSRKFARHLE